VLLGQHGCVLEGADEAVGIQRVSIWFWTTSHNFIFMISKLGMFPGC
jgi:hypothetical protein